MSSMLYSESKKLKEKKSTVGPRYSRFRHLVDHKVGYKRRICKGNKAKLQAQIEIKSVVLVFADLNFSGTD